VPVKQYERRIAKATTDDWLPACGTLWTLVNIKRKLSAGS
jgi:hypothetical protein